jgi:hypothetical protein
LLPLAVDLLKRWWRPITNLLDFSLARYEYTLGAAVIGLHVQILQLIKQNPDSQKEIEYDPNVMVSYVTGLLRAK